MQHWLHQIRCSGGGTTTSFAFIGFSCASPFQADAGIDPLEIHCSPPDGGIPVVRRSIEAFEAQRIEPDPHCGPVQKELASCTYGNGRQDTTAYRRIWMIEKYA
jgi:hypothetical protein